MNFSIVSDDRTIFLSKAILVYQTKNGNSYESNETTYASVHSVEDTGTKARPNVQIMPGTPITQESLLELMGSLADQYVVNTELLPENVLSYSPTHLVWWLPAGKRSVFFNNKELGKRSAVLPHPPMLFLVINKQWFVYAMDANVRPSKETVLYHAPYFNVYDNGSICSGTAAIPNRLSTTTIPSWENAFFDSEFTHVNGQIKKISHPDGEYAFWKAMLDGKYPEFPSELLVKAEMNLGGAMEVIRKTYKR